MAVIYFVFNFLILLRRVEEDLETMWQVASKDNRQMRDMTRKMARKLQSHERFRDVDDDDMELLLKDPGDRIYEIPPGDDK